MKLLIIIPAYNEAQVIAQTIGDIQKKTVSIKPDILVVDDGSSDNTAQVAQSSGALLVRHPFNRGLGGAIATGLEFARRYNYDLALTFDADGQHDPSDIMPALQPILDKKADIVIGTRTQNLKQLPFDRRFLILASNALTFLLFHQTTSDSQSGFRAFSRRAIDSIKLKTDRMEVSSELFSEIRRLRLELAQVPIKVIYTPYSRSKGQKNTNAIHIIYKLILRLFR